MNVPTVWWLTCVALIKNFSCNEVNPFVLEELELRATEGSCTEIKCKQTEQPSYQYKDDYWFWMKDSNWTEEAGFRATIVFSTYKERPVSPLFQDRVQYINDASKSGPAKLCHIVICDLKKADSGNYAFRYEDKEKKWATKPETNLTVVENPCPITFEKPPVVMENHTVTLTCSTLKSCSSKLKIDSLMEPHKTALLNTPNVSTSLTTSENTTSKSITYIFNTSWTDDQTEFSCQTSDNDDRHLVRSFNLTVRYAPREVKAETSSEKVKEQDPMTLTCSAKGSPNVTFSWFRNDQKLDDSDREMKVTSAEDSHSGLYHCEAENEYGKGKSNNIKITVIYAPEVNVRELPEKITEGDRISLECNVKRSQPPPHVFVWHKDGEYFGKEQIYNFASIQPNDSGNYRCEATNNVSSGRSESSHLRVHYKPRSSISIDGTNNDNEVSVSSGITFTCNTSAYPKPSYSWFRHNQSNPSQRIFLNYQMQFSLKSVQRADEGCYTCNASNSVGEGKTSEPKCIRVRYPPTNVVLSMDTTVREGRSITITCSAESYPLSTFTIKRSNSQSPEWQIIDKSTNQHSFSHNFTATDVHAGSYICIASNSENTTTSQERKLVVEYGPKNVTVSPSEIVVKENYSISLTCNAQCHPPPNRFTWTKSNTTFDKNTKSYFVPSASPSDRGLYSCTAENEFGTGSSPQVNVEVEYAPKQTTIIRGEEGQFSNGTRSVELRCNSTCYPAATYVWHRKTEGQVHEGQTFTVYSDTAVEYSCVAKNEIGEKSSDWIMLFDDSWKKKVLLVLFISSIFILFLFIVLYRRKRKKSIQQRTANTWPCGGFVAWWTRGRRRNTASEMGLVGPFRSRDDLLPDRPCHPNGRPHQPRPDVASASNISTVYCTVNTPHGKQAPSAQKPARQQGGHKEDDSLNYASLHFQKKQTKPEEDAIYSKVSKPKPSKAKEEGVPGDYENISALVKPYNLYESDSDTSEDEEEVSYTQVNIRQQRPKRDSSSSEDATEYSLVKI